MDNLLKRTGLALGVIAERTGLTYGYVRQLSAGNKQVGPDVAPKLAPFLRARADELDDEADAVAVRMRADAAALRAAADKLDPPAALDEEG